MGEVVREGRGDRLRMRETVDFERVREKVVDSEKERWERVKEDCFGRLRMREEISEGEGCRLRDGHWEKGFKNAPCFS